MKTLSWAVWGFLLFFGVSVWAEVPAGAKPIEDGAPVLKAGDAAMEPEVVIRREGTTQIKEYRMNGRAYQMEVKPDGMPSYYLVDQQGDGQWMKIDSHNPLVVPQWVLIRF